MLKTTSELLKNAYIEMQYTKHDDVLKYNIPFLDDLTGGIFKDNLVLVGARSGEGKSELVGQIAYKTALKGKKVVFFNLEDGEEGFVRRLVSLKLSQKLKKSFAPIDFRTNRLVSEHEELLNQCFRDVKEEIGDNIKIYSGKGVPSIQDFEDIITKEAEREDIDLIVVDHLHYFSMHELQEQSSVQLAKIMRKIRMLTKNKEIPVLMAAHLSKPQKEEKAPCKYDFHGSSDIAKEATVCVLLWRKENFTDIILDKNRDGRYLRTETCKFDPIKGGFYCFEKQAGFDSHSGIDNEPELSF